MTVTSFPKSPRRGDPNGHIVVQSNLDYLRDVVDSKAASTQGGSATITVGLTNVAVSHSLGASTYRAVATPLVNPGGTWWISNKTTVGFQINLQNAAPAGGVAFDWVAIK